MAISIFSLVPEERISDVLCNLHDFTGLTVQLIDSDGSNIMTFGHFSNYCSVLKKKVFDETECFKVRAKAGQTAQAGLGPLRGDLSGKTQIPDGGPLCEIPDKAQL